jgi:hypothetical protein
MLMDHADAMTNRRPGIVDIHLSLVDEYFACVAAKDPVEYIHQSRFPGSVLAQESMNFSRFQIETDALVRGDAVEILADVVQPYYGHSASSSAVNEDHGRKGR